MNNIFIRILLISLALFGVYKIFPQISGPVDYYLKNPQFQASVVVPVIKGANKILPDKLQLPSIKVMGVNTGYTDEPPLKTLTDEISKQAASVAAGLVEKSSKAVSDQFCNALLEKIKTECGQ